MIFPLQKKKKKKKKKEEVRSKDKMTLIGEYM